MFIEIENKNCLVVGGGTVALRKVQVLLDFGANVLVVAPEILPEICSLDTPTGDDDDGTLGMLVENLQSAQPYEELVREELNQTLETLLGTLSPRQQQVLRLHFGMEDGTCHSLEQIGAVLEILASSIGSLTNPLKLSNTFRSAAGVSIADKTVAGYLSCLEDAFLVDKAKRYDVKGRKYLSTPTKYYFTDLGLRNAALNFRQQEENHIMENIIYLELLRRGFSVDVGIVETAGRNAEGKTVRSYAEVDFVANRGNNRFYIQSAFAMDTEEKQAQEKNSLLHIKDFFKRIIVVKDDIKRKRDEYGIVTMGICDFLLDENSMEY